MEDPIKINTVVPPAEHPAQGVLSRLAADLRAALLGTHRDFTEGSIGRAILLLAVPVVLEMAMQSLFSVVDVFFVGKLGADAVATVGVTDSLLTVVFAIAMGLSMASMATVARRIGEKNPEAAAVAVVQAIALGTVVAVILGIVGYLSAPALLRLMKTSPEVIATGSTFCRIMLAGNITILLLFLINAMLRGAGDTAIAMRVLWLANIVNMLLDPCLIFGWGPFPELGVTGAAVATTTGRSVGVLYQFYVLFRGRGRVRLRAEHLRLEPEVMLRLLRISVGGIFQYMIASGNWLGLVRIMATFGSAALAGYTIAVRIIVFSILPSWGMGAAAATLVGQNLGAGKPDRAERSVWLSGFCNMVFLGVVAVAFIVFAEPLVRLFTDDPQVLPIGTACLRYISYGYVFYAYGMVIVQSFNGAGDTFTPTLINLFVYWLFQIPLAYTLALPLGLGPKGVFLAITIAESTLAVVGALVFRRGYWKQRKV